MKPEDHQEGTGEPPEPLSALAPVDPVARIAVLLRHIDDQLASLRHEAWPGRHLSVPQEVPDLDLVLGPVEDALVNAARELGLQAQLRDVRSRVRGPLHILWADLVELSPEGLRKHWGVREVPQGWPRLHRDLMEAVEGAIARLGEGTAPPTDVAVGREHLAHGPAASAAVASGPVRARTMRSTGTAASSATIEKATSPASETS